MTSGHHGSPKLAGSPSFGDEPGCYRGNGGIAPNSN